MLKPGQAATKAMHAGPFVPAPRMPPGALVSSASLAFESSAQGGYAFRSAASLSLMQAVDWATGAVPVGSELAGPAQGSAPPSPPPPKPASPPSAIACWQRV